MGLDKGHTHFGNTVPFLQPPCFHLSIKATLVWTFCVLSYLVCELCSLLPSLVSNNTLQ